MKYVQKTSKNITNNFLMNLFIDRGLIPENDIEYQKRYFNPTKQNLLDYKLLDNIEKGAELLEKHIKNGGSIYIIVD